MKSRGFIGNLVNASLSSSLSSWSPFSTLPRLSTFAPSFIRSFSSSYFKPDYLKQHTTAVKESMKNNKTTFSKLGIPQEQHALVAQLLVTHGHPYRLTEDSLINFFQKTFAFERNDLILKRFMDLEKLRQEHRSLTKAYEYIKDQFKDAEDDSFSPDVEKRKAWYNARHKIFNAETAATNKAMEISRAEEELNKFVSHYNFETRFPGENARMVTSNVDSQGNIIENRQPVIDFETYKQTMQKLSERLDVSKLITNSKDAAENVQRSFSITPKW